MAFTIIWCFYMCSPLNIIWLSSIFIKVYKLYKHLEWWHDLGSFGVHKMSTTDKLWKFHGGAQTSGRIIKWVWIQSVKNHQLSLKFQEHISLVNGRFLRNQNGIHIYIYYKQPIIVFTDWKRNLPSSIGTWSGNPEMFSGKSGYFNGFLHIWGSIILSNFQVSCGMDLLMPHPFSNFNAFHVGPIPVVSLSGKRWCYVGGLIVSENANEITNLRRSTAAAGSFSEVLSMVFHRKTCIIDKNLHYWGWEQVLKCLILMLNSESHSCSSRNNTALQ